MVAFENININQVLDVISSKSITTSAGISSEQLQNLSDKLAKLAFSYDDFIQNKCFIALANIDETIGNFLHDDDGAIQISLRIGEAYSMISSSATFVYYNESHNLAPNDASIGEVKGAIFEIISVIAKYLKKLTQLRQHNFYYSMLSYSSDLSSSSPRECLKTADSNLFTSISDTLGFCTKMIGR